MPEQPDESTPSLPGGQPEGLWRRLRHVLFGKPRDISEPNIFHRLSLIPILAWIGLGADGLSSSSYGPEEAFRALQGHTYMAFGLAAATALTVIIIAAAYSRIIEEFPSGGGGYLVASKLLGPKFGVLSGCALLVDYALTIAVSIVAAGDNMFSVFPPEWQAAKLPVTMLLIVLLIFLNIRGVRESVLALAPIFILFLVTHIILVGVGVFAHTSNLPAVVSQTTEGFTRDSGVIGLGAMLLIFARAFSMGGGTYTGLEAVSNGMPIMREPRVHTARRTMMYMAISLSLMAGGLIVCYLLWGIEPEPGKTMNAVLAQHVADGFPFANTFVFLTLFAAGALLIVGAQAGFIDGPRVLSNMAVDSWVPRHFATLSERFTTMNGIVLMGVASLAVVAYTHGNIHSLVVMYSINVFLTFSLSMFGMLKVWISRKGVRLRLRRIGLFGVGFLLCITVLTITVFEKFEEGGWMTVAVTAMLVVVCLIIRRHYRAVATQLGKLQNVFADLPAEATGMPLPELDSTNPTAAVLVASYGGLGIHTLLNIFRSFPNQFRNLVFLSVGVVDSGEMKGAEEIDALRTRTEGSLKQYVDLANRLGYPATYRMLLGADVVEEAHNLCLGTIKDFPKVTFFAGQLVFHQEAWYHRLLHNSTAFSLQRRLFLDGQTMVVLPMRVK
jgi:amino acid transporter